MALNAPPNKPDFVQMIGALIAQWMLFTQTLGIFSGMFIPWPRDYASVLSVAEISLLRTDQLQIFCHISDTQSKYAVRVVIWWIMVVTSGMFYFLSKFGKRNRWTVESTLCSIGLLSQNGFTTMVSVAIVP